MTVTAVGVVIPARDEEQLLPACLDALAVAVDAVALPVQIVVALDGCRDGTRQVIADRPWIGSVDIDVANVGRARAAAVDTLLELTSLHPAEELWIACTDADSIVPPDWLSTQLRLAADGWEVVVGTVDVADWSEHDDEVRRAFVASYQRRERHSHVHGANLGMTASSYLAAGGFPPLTVSEDVALIARLADRRVIRTAAHPVVTSARRQPRARGGFGDRLRSLAG